MQSVLMHSITYQLPMLFSMDIAQLQARFNLMKSEITACQQLVQNLNATILAQAQQINNVQHQDFQRLQELKLKEAELQACSKRAAKLQELLEQKNDAMADAEAQMDEVAGLGRQSLRCLEQYKKQNEELIRRLNNVRQSESSHGQHMQSLSRLLAGNSQGTFSNHLHPD